MFNEGHDAVLKDCAVTTELLDVLKRFFALWVYGGIVFLFSLV